MTISSTDSKARLKVSRRKFYRLNYQIPSLQLRLLDETGKQIGLVSKLEALQKAKELGIDIVEIAPNAKPPVAKLIDFKKFKYQEAKKERESRKSQKNVGVKEIRLRPFIGEHDFQTRLTKAKAFLEDGNQLKLSLMFRGRENAHREFGYNTVNRFIDDLKEIKVTRPPHMEGRVLVAMVVSDKKGETKGK